MIILQLKHTKRNAFIRKDKRIYHLKTNRENPHLSSAYAKKRFIYETCKYLILIFKNTLINSYFSLYFFIIPPEISSVILLCSRKITNS